MSQLMNTTTLFSLNQNLRLVYKKMIQHEEKGQYVDAERCRLEWNHRKEQLKNKQLYQMDMTHKRQRLELHNDCLNQINRIDNFWDTKMNEIRTQADRNIEQMMTRHNQQCIKLQEELGLQLSTKVKQSSQLLNLRKMEEQMAKQKNYAQAHRVQQKIKKIFTHEEQVWLDKRNQKIDQALFNLRNKQSTQLINLKKRIKTSEEDNTKDHHFQVLRIKQKYENSLKDLKAHQERQTLSFKGQFRTLGGGSPTSSPTRSKIGNEIKV